MKCGEIFDGRRSWWKFNFWGKYWTLCLLLTVFRVNWEGLSDESRYQRLIGLAEHQPLASHAHEAAARRSLISSVINAVGIVIEALRFVICLVVKVFAAAFLPAHSHETFWSSLVTDRTSANQVVVTEFFAAHPEKSLRRCPLGQKRWVAVVGLGFRFDKPCALAKPVQILGRTKNGMFPD